MYALCISTNFCTLAFEWARVSACTHAQIFVLGCIPWVHIMNLGPTSKLEHLSLEAIPNIQAMYAFVCRGEYCTLSHIASAIIIFLYFY